MEYFGPTSWPASVIRNSDDWGTEWNCGDGCWRSSVWALGVIVGALGVGLFVTAVVLNGVLANADGSPSSPLDPLNKIVGSIASA